MERGDPAGHLAGRTVLLAHGDRDRITDPGASRRFVEQAAGAGADARFVLVPGEGHAMLRRSAYWSGLVLDFVRRRLDRPERQAPGVS